MIVVRLKKVIMVVSVVVNIGMNMCLVVFFVVMVGVLFKCRVWVLVCLFIMMVLLIMILSVMINLKSEIILIVMFVRYINVMVVYMVMGIFVVI